MTGAAENRQLKRYQRVFRDLCSSIPFNLVRPFRFVAARSSRELLFPLRRTHESFPHLVRLTIQTERLFRGPDPTDTDVDSPTTDPKSL
jgi:hypothetical protein